MDNLMEDFFNGANGNKPEDYYFVRDKKGAKLYYSKITNKRIAKDRIRKSIIEKIQEKDPGFDVANLLNLKNIYLKEIRELQNKIADIDIKLNSYDEEKIKDFQRQKEREEEEIKKRKIEYERERKERLRKLFEEFDRSSNKRGRIPPPSEEQKEPKFPFLEQFTIKTKKEWFDWLSKNHPDKGGDEKICQDVIAEGRAKGWC